MHRARLRTQGLVIGQLPGWFEQRWSRAVTAAPGWPSAFVPLDARLSHGYPDPVLNADGLFRFLNDERTLGSPPDWDQRDAERLWRFNLHYLECGWSFAAHPDAAWARAAFGRLWRSWRASTPLGHRDGWAPYVASVRAWALCGVYRALVAGTEHEEQYVAALRLHAAFLRVHLERDVGGNHLIKNLKALIGLGVFLGDPALVTAGVRGLEQQLPVQILADGGHFERSPAYHCQVLGDLAEVRDLVAAYGHEPVAGLEPALERMREWLGVMLMPDGDVPLFNDCTLVGEERLRLLRPVPPPGDPLLTLQPSGYVVCRPSPDVHLVVDVGPPCPPELPAHAHADCLSFELAVHGRRTITDTGTSTYEPGPQRQYERSTRAHNTLEIDEEDQTEVWGTFRAARRATPRLEHAAMEGGAAVVIGSHDGYGRLSGSPRHRRTFRVRHDEMTIVDDVSGAGIHHVAVYLHPVPTTTTVLGSEAETPPPGGIRVSGAIDELWHSFVRVVGGWVATGFGERQPAEVLVLHARQRLPVRLWTRIEWAPADR